MANREKYVRDLVRDWIEGNDNTIPTRARSSRVIGSYTKNRKCGLRRRPPAIMYEQELLESALRLMAAPAAEQNHRLRIHAAMYDGTGRRRAREPRRELRRKPRGQRCGYRR